MITTSHLILYVVDQAASTAFYSAVLARAPSLDVPGMTEFRLGDGCVLGLMPAAGIRRLLGERLPDPMRAAGVPRAELYLRVDDPAAYHRRALAHGALELSGLLERDWGDIAAYSLDPDGHVLAFAAPSRGPHHGRQTGSATSAAPSSITAPALAPDAAPQHPETGRTTALSPEQIATVVRDAVIDTALQAHEDAGLQGLCHEGRWEYALDAVRGLDLERVLSLAGGRPGSGWDGRHNAEAG